MHASLEKLFDLTDQVAIVTGATKGPDRSAMATMQQRVADCDEVIGAALYLASNASSFVTGEDHVVAGGMLRC